MHVNFIINILCVKDYSNNANCIYETCHVYEYCTKKYNMI